MAKRTQHEGKNVLMNKAEEILKIIYDAPYILDLLFRSGQLGKEASNRYMFGTISNTDVDKIKEFFSDGKGFSKSK